MTESGTFRTIDASYAVWLDMPFQALRFAHICDLNDGVGKADCANSAFVSTNLPLTSFGRTSRDDSSGLVSMSPALVSTSNCSPVMAFSRIIVRGVAEVKLRVGIDVSPGWHPLRRLEDRNGQKLLRYRQICGYIRLGKVLSEIPMGSNRQSSSR